MQFYLSHIMRKPAFCICKNKGTTQIVLSLYFLNPKFQALAIFFGCTARFVSNLGGHLEDHFSRDVAQYTFCKWYNYEDFEAPFCCLLEYI